VTSNCTECAGGRTDFIPRYRSKRAALDRRVTVAESVIYLLASDKSLATSSG
jgi:hypothetical protein